MTPFEHLVLRALLVLLYCAIRGNDPKAHKVISDIEDFLK